MLTEDQQNKLRSLFDTGLVRGIGNQKQTCIEGALCLILYGDLSDKHRGEKDCRGQSIVYASIRLNDANWSSPAARSAGLWDLALAQIDSAHLDQTRIARRYTELTIRQVLPIALRKAGLSEAASRCERDGDETSARAAGKAANAANANAANAAAAYAAAAYVAANAADAAANVANVAADDVAADDVILSLSAKLLVQAIKEAR